MAGLLKDKIAIVTGGTSGIGLATVEKFLEGGTKVVIGDINDAKGKSQADRLGDDVLYVNADVTDEEAIENLVDVAVEFRQA